MTQRKERRPWTPERVLAHVRNNCHVDPATDFWIFHETRNAAGRKRPPSVWVYGRSVSAPRAAWEAYHGTPLGPRIVRPSCGEDRCCNPRHRTACTWSEFNKAH